MKLVGFDFKKISGERFKDVAEAIRFNTKLDIISISPLKSDVLRTKDELLKVEFVYSVLYEPEFAKIELAGKIILAVEPRISREVLRGWKDKETSDEFRVFMFNIILRKTNILALQIEEDLGLPPHIPLPSVNKESMKEQKEQK